MAHRYPGRTGNRYRIKYKKRFAATIVILVIIAVALFINSSYFNVTPDTVSVTGDERFHEDDIKNSAVELISNVNIFRLDELEITKLIENANPYVTVVDIIRALPNKVEIVIRQRESVMQFCYGGAYYDAASNGVIMSDARSKDPALMQIIGFNINKPVRGSKFSIDDEQLYNDFNEIIDYLRLSDSMSRISEISFEDRNNVLFYTNGYKVILGVPLRVATKIKYALDSTDALYKEGKRGGTIDVSVEGSAYYLPPEQ